MHITMLQPDNRQAASDSARRRQAQQNRNERTFAAPAGGEIPCVALAKSLLSDPARLHYLCWCPQRQRRVWSTMLKPLYLSIADAIALAPVFKFTVQQPIVFPVAGDGVQSINWVEVHHKPVGAGIRVICILGGADIAYPEFLAAACGENLPNRWFLHSSGLH